MEIWKDIPGYEGLYQVSSTGKVKSLKRRIYDINNKKVIFIERDMILKPSENNKGYYTVKLQKDKQKKTITIHRIVANTFLDNSDNLPQINHIDGNKHNNNVENLEWCDNTYNFKHATDNKLIKTRKIKVKDIETNIEYFFDNLHKMFRQFEITPSGSYKKFINQNRLYKGRYILEDIEKGW